MADDFIFYFMITLLLFVFVGSIVFLAYMDHKQKAGLKKNEAIIFGIKWTWSKCRLGDILDTPESDESDSF